MENAQKIHKIWYKFYNFLADEMGIVLYEGGNDLFGYEKQEIIRDFVSKNPEIKILDCDDAEHASSMLVLVPHPTHGITVIFVPQNQAQNRFFLYKKAAINFISVLADMNKKIYENMEIRTKLTSETTRDIGDFYEKKQKNMPSQSVFKGWLQSILGIRGLEHVVGDTDILENLSEQVVRDAYMFCVGIHFGEFGLFPENSDINTKSHHVGTELLLGLKKLKENGFY